MPTHPTVRVADERLARRAESTLSVDETLALLTKSALETIPRVDYVSISMREGDGAVQTLAPTHQLAVQVDELQYALHQGPCYDAVGGEPLLVAPDLARDARWPEYGPQAAGMGIGGQMAVQLFADGHIRAALNLYSRDAGRFDANIEVAELFASHAALVMGFARTAEHLDQGLKSRKVIGQAIGIIMERYELDEDRAFGFLTGVSQTSNVKLRQVAQEVVDERNSRRSGDSDGQNGHRHMTAR